MKRVLKYQLREPLVPRHIPLPIDHKIVLTGYQHEKFCIWTEVDDEQDREESFIFTVYPTGHPIPDNAEHIASFGTPDNLTIWHVYREDS